MENIPTPAVPTFPTLETRPLQAASEAETTASPAVIVFTTTNSKRAATWAQSTLANNAKDWPTTIIYHLIYILYHGDSFIPLPESLRGLPAMLDAFRAEFTTAAQADVERAEREREAARRDPATQLARQLTRHDAF